MEYRSISTSNCYDTNNTNKSFYDKTGTFLSDLELDSILLTVIGWKRVYTSSLTLSSKSHGLGMRINDDFYIWVN